MVSKEILWRPNRVTKPNRVVAEVSDSVYKHRKFFRRPDPTPVVCAAGGYIRSNIGSVPSVCNEPVTGSQSLGSSHRLGRCCLPVSSCLHGFLRDQNFQTDI